MCMSCGCCEPQNAHGDSRTLVRDDLAAAARQANTDIPGVIKNIIATAQAHGDMAKSDDETVFEGSVIKADATSRFLLLVAYSPNEIPKRGADGRIDVARPEVLEKACWRFMDNGAIMGKWHEDGFYGSSRVVENYIYRGPNWMIKTKQGTRVIKAGAWMVGVICDEDTWGEYEKGLIGGASPQGSAARRRASREFVEQLRRG